MSDIEQMDGIVEKTGYKKIGKRTYYNFFLEDDDTMYKCGTNDPDLNEGDSVEFEYEDGDYGCMVDMDSLEVIDAAPKQRRSKKKASSKKRPTKTSRGTSARDATKKSGGGTSKDDYWAAKDAKDDDRQKIIMYQSAYKTALDIVNSQLANGLLVLATEKAAKGKKLAAFNDAIDEKALELYAKFSNATSVSTKPVKAVEDDVADDQVEDDEQDEEEGWDD